MRDNITYSVYVHKVSTENGPQYYTGVTKNINRRWFGSGYRKTSLYDYIKQYGWESIEHAVIFETNDRKKAYEIEDYLIRFYSSIGHCLNKNRSGLILSHGKTAYARNRYANDQEYREKQRQYFRDRYSNDQEYRERQCKRYRDKQANDPEWVEKRCQYYRDKRATTEGRIYDRVRAFNRRHPDCVIETALEAKNKYLASGYIPTYIKHDDLI